MKTNKKGMTLVECIVAMAVFAIATAGFTMAATACMKAQVKSSKRMTKTNVQSTNLEHFSSYSQVLDPSFTNVSPMTSGANQFQMTFDFGSTVIVNKNVYGYYAQLDSEDKDKVYDLSYFTSAEQVNLSADEYWVTLYNCDAKQQSWTLELNSDAFTFFDNQKDPTAGQKLPRHNWAPNGGYYKFGIKQLKAGNLAACLKITSHGETSTSIYPDAVGITEDCMLNKSIPNGGDNMVSIYYEGGKFMTAKAYNEKHKNDTIEE